jgi:hypothetical protein
VQRLPRRLHMLEEPESHAVDAEPSRKKVTQRQL